MDRIKGEEHLPRLLTAEPWDLVIFDEAHRLSRRQYALKLERSDRYKMPQALRHRTANMLPLTATPHQGRADKFTPLLELLRPDEIDRLPNRQLASNVLVGLGLRHRKKEAP